MNLEVKKIWIEKLRSGEYEQIEGRLKVINFSKNSYCCLGVLCDIHNQYKLGEWVHGLYQTEDEEQTEILPHSVKKWAGLENNCGDVVCIRGVTRALSEHNDLGVSFSEIADAIEEQL